MQHHDDPLMLGYRQHPHQAATPQPSYSADRLTRIEIEISRLAQAMTYGDQVVRDRGRTIEAHDERIRKMGSRIGKLEDGMVTVREQQQATTAKVEKLAELPSRLDAEKARMETLMSVAKVLGGFVLLALASAMKLPVDAVLKLLGK